LDDAVTAAPQIGSPVPASVTATVAKANGTPQSSLQAVASRIDAYERALQYALAVSIFP
jgi:hypothetical protein